jgi:hypothetical protein
MSVLELYLIYLLPFYNRLTFPVLVTQPLSGQGLSWAFNPLLCILHPSTVGTRMLRNQWISGWGGKI